MDQSERYCYKPTLRWNPLVEGYFIKAYGAEHFARISKALTCPSCYSCIRVNTLKSTSDAVIERLWAVLQGTRFRNATDCISKSRGDASAEVDMGQKNGCFAEEVNGYRFSDFCSKTILELYGEVDALNTGSQSVPISKCQLPGLDYVLFVKGSGPNAVQYADAPIKLPKEVIVSRKCAEAVLRGAQVYVPGVLACSAHVEKGDTIAVSVAIEQPGLDSGWGVGITPRDCFTGIGNSFVSDAHYLERTGLYIGEGTAMMSRAGIFRASEGLAVEMTNRVFNLPSFHDVLEGEIFLQNLPSIITAHALDPQPGERILDMCAAPGGKTTAIAILMKDRGEVVAVDRSHNKVLDIQKLAAEMGLNCITTHKLDALKAVCRKIDSSDFSSICCNRETSDVCIGNSGALNIPIENVVSITTTGLCADLACKENEKSETTNRGAYLSKVDIRKNMRRRRNGPGRNQCIGGRVEHSKGFPPNSFDRVLLDAPCSALGLRPRLFAGDETIESLKSHGKYQRRMFDQAVQLVRAGGVIVYSTCTINPGENEALVRYALDTYSFLSLAPQKPRIGGPGIVGCCELFGEKHVEEWLRPGEEDLVQRFDPSSPLDTIGFFIAKFQVGDKDS